MAEVSFFLMNLSLIFYRIQLYFLSTNTIFTNYLQKTDIGLITRIKIKLSFICQMEIQPDILSDFKTSRDPGRMVITSIIVIYAVLMIGTSSYIFWLFKDVAIYFKDQEFQVLIAVHFVYPAILLALFLSGKKLGWALMVMHSVLNVSYAVYTYLEAWERDIYLLAFIVHGILSALYFHKQVIDSFKISRTWRISIVLATCVITLLFILSRL